jgi:hypothetical protein
MNALPPWYQSIAGLVGDSIVCLLVVKWTVLLTTAWLAHGRLAGGNPRWRLSALSAHLARPRRSGKLAPQKTRGRWQFPPRRPRVACLN